MLDYMTLKLIWWLLIGVLLIGFAIMDGHDMGVGTLLPVLARDDTDRRVMINTIGPVWDGNETWLVLGGGGLKVEGDPLASPHGGALGGCVGWVGQGVQGAHHGVAAHFFFVHANVGSGHGLGCHAGDGFGGGGVGGGVTEGGEGLGGDAGG
jgi:hypothetical protein